MQAEILGVVDYQNGEHIVVITIKIDGKTTSEFFLQNTFITKEAAVLEMKNEILRLKNNMTNALLQ